MQTELRKKQSHHLYTYIYNFPAIVSVHASSMRNYNPGEISCVHCRQH